MATPSLKWDASDVALKVTTASGGVVTMSFPDRASDVAFNMPLTALINPMTTAGDVIVATTDGVPARVAIGTNGQVLQSDGTTAVWASLSYMENPMTTAGDLIVGGESGAPARLAKGTDAQVLTMVSGGVAWADATGGTGGFENPMTAVGDLILGGADGAAGRLAIGTTGKVLTSNGTTATWEAPVTGFSNPMTTLGDIITADTGGAAKRVGVGSEGQILKVVSGEPAWGNVSTVSVSDVFFDNLLNYTGYTAYPGNYTVGVGFFVTEACNCAGIKFKETAEKSVKICLYDAAGTLMATKTATSAIGLNTFLFDTPQALTVYSLYKVTMYRTDGSAFMKHGGTTVYNTWPLVVNPKLYLTKRYYITGDNNPTTETTYETHPLRPVFS